ncbi:MAG: HAMP domain-containing sensor histidine kinase, partial [Gemmataceae bacterium]
DLLVRSRDGLKRIQQIVQDLRSFARLNESEVDTVDLAPYLESAAAIARGLAEKRGVKLSCHVTALPPLPCQPARLNEAVFNLLANAIDACPAGGVVTLCGRPAAERIEVEVLDNGCGIDPALREKIFDPFFTTKPIGQGVGLGLSTSHGIVTEHGGAIDVESTPGKGSRFTIRLPLKGIGAPNDGTVKLGEAKAGPAS